MGMWLQYSRIWSTNKAHSFSYCCKGTANISCNECDCSYRLTFLWTADLEWHFIGFQYNSLKATVWCLSLGSNYCRPYSTLGKMQDFYDNFLSNGTSTFHGKSAYFICGLYKLTKFRYSPEYIYICIYTMKKSYPVAFVSWCQWTNFLVCLNGSD